jgi:hypothetical protein
VHQRRRNRLPILNVLTDREIQMTLLHPGEKFPNLAVTPTAWAAPELPDIRRLGRDYRPVGSERKLMTSEQEAGLR